MLKRHRKSAPSLILHLHPTHFRLDQQEGSFSYNSPARKLLEHVKDQTVPHDMLDELHQAGVKFYEGKLCLSCPSTILKYAIGCLIVQVHDHRKTSKDAASSSTSNKSDGNQPYSIHNYNQYITPSPYVPYPSNKLQDASYSADANLKEQSALPQSSAAEQRGNQEATPSKTSQGPRVYTTVLFPTPLTVQEDVLRYACAVNPRTFNRKGSQIGSSRAATAGGVASSSVGAGPPAKKPRLQYSNKSLQSIESTIILSTAPPLYLDPVNSIEESQALLEKLADPLCCREPPAPKSRKRTIAELAADEALAAEEQRFMLIMDERLAPNATATGTGKAGTDAGGSGTNFEARFERFKTLEEIKEMISQKKERETQQAQHAQALKAKAEQERASEHRAQIVSAKRQQEQQQQMVRNQSLHQTSGPQQLLQAQQQQQASAQQQGTQSSAQHTHPGTANAAVANTHQLAVSQAAQSSPIVRNPTPHAGSSPAVGQVPNRVPSAVPMNVTNSTQGAGSPPRPGSALQHGHPAPVPMAAQRSQQPPPSRNGTPSMPNGTPRLQQGTPVMRNITPTPRMNQASPVNSVSAGTPMMSHNMLGAAHLNGQPQFTSQQMQQQAFLRAQQQQQQARQNAQLAQAYQQSQQLHGSPPNAHLSQQQRLHQLAAQQAQHAAMGGADGNAYRQMLQNMSAQQMRANGGMANGMMMHQGQNPFANQQQQQHNMGIGPADMMNDPRIKSIITQTASRIFEVNKMALMQSSGQNLSIENLQQLKNQAISEARRQVLNRQRQQQHAMMNQQMQNGVMNSMGGM